MAFDAYGYAYSLAPQGQSDPYDPVGFGGQYGYYRDSYTNLSLLAHRYYDAGTGRFVNRDPIGYKGGLNLYGFAGNNPVNRMDPEGTQDSSTDSMQYVGNMFNNLTATDVLHALKHNDVTDAVGVLLNGLSWIPLPENPVADERVVTVVAEVGSPAARSLFSGASKEIALGLDPYYKKLAAGTGSATWREWAGRIVNTPTSPRFGRLFNQSVKKASRIHFALDGIGDVQQAVRKGAQGFVRDNFTNAELHQIMTNPKIRAKTTFYLGGKIVTP